MEAKKVSLKCVCGKVISAPTQRSAEVSMDMHAKTSVLHREVMAALKRLRGKAV